MRWAVFIEERQTMRKHTIVVTSVLALALSGATLVNAATPVHAATARPVVAHGTQRAAVTVNLRSGARLTVALPVGAVVTGLGAGANLVATGAHAAATGGEGGVSPLARYINITNPGNNSRVAVNQYQNFSFHWSGGGCCNETFTSHFANLTAGGSYDFDKYNCGFGCTSADHSFSKLFATAGNRWQYTVYDQNGNASPSIYFTTY